MVKKPEASGQLDEIGDIVIKREKVLGVEQVSLEMRLNSDSSSRVYRQDVLNLVAGLSSENGDAQLLANLSTSQSVIRTPDGLINTSIVPDDFTIIVRGSQNVDRFSNKLREMAMARLQALPRVL